ncbi:mediator of RNA polymerase II transcription subunit 4 [Zygosaccharomyces mellis]|uniref:Mediator of RNA polymerase II transcription subunit 4 n=1 Tax=Zygosaccharomyces mellis TaxID=42258 RepID=A0A4C2E7C9_9SACH|nr:mediator of RNA polymerase II transcription subunit 4 [Zygosaccharomyces mellis]
MLNQNEFAPDTPANILSRGHIRSSSTSLISDAMSSGNNNEDELSKVQIYGDLTQYEEKLGALVKTVDNFKPDVNIVHELIAVDKSLYKNLDSFAEYDRIDSELNRLDKESNELDRKTKEVLETLSECYEMLNTLPMLEQVEFEKQTILKQRSKVNSSVLLNYATKLSKFTKIPPTFDKGTIGPNNFVWPAEDALRRGMLAIASLHSKEMTRIPGEPEEERSGAIEEDKSLSNIEDKAETEERAVSPGIRRNERRPSFVFTENPTETVNGDNNNEPDDEALDLDLDLFKPDEF